MMSLRLFLLHLLYVPLIQAQDSAITGLGDYQLTTPKPPGDVLIVNVDPGNPPKGVTPVLRRWPSESAPVIFNYCTGSCERGTEESSAHFVHVTYYYLNPANKKCLDPDVKSEFASLLRRFVGSPFERHMKQFLDDNDYPSDEDSGCLVADDGFIERSSVKYIGKNPQPDLPPEESEPAKVIPKLECKDCKDREVRKNGANEPKSPIADIQEVMKASKADHKLIPCEGVVDTGVIKVQLDKVGRSCVPSVVDCGTPKASDHTKATAIADHMKYLNYVPVKRAVAYCEYAIQSFNDQCGFWNEKKDEYDRFATMERIAEVQAFRVPKKTPSMNKILLGCLVRQENDTLAPNRLNYRLCRRDTTSANHSDAFGFNMMLKSTFDDECERETFTFCKGVGQKVGELFTKLKTAAHGTKTDLKLQDEAFERVTGTLFDAMGQNVDWQMETMAKYMGELMQRHKSLSASITAYDRDHKSEYVKGTIACYSRCEHFLSDEKKARAQIKNLPTKAEQDQKTRELDDQIMRGMYDCIWRRKLHSQSPAKQVAKATKKAAPKKKKVKRKPQSANEEGSEQ